ncbi:conjugal transfer protein TraG N-terminal domain-containing protein [Serratia sp. PAMC26656]
MGPRWLYSWLLEALYGSDTYSRWNEAGFQNSTDDLIMNLVMGCMFIVLPAVWLGAFSWAGMSVGHSVSAAIATGMQDSKAARSQLGSAAGSVITHKVSKG